MGTIERAWLTYFDTALSPTLGVAELRALKRAFYYGAFAVIECMSITEYAYDEVTKIVNEIQEFNEKVKKGLA